MEYLKTLLNKYSYQYEFVELKHSSKYFQWQVPENNLDQFDTSKYPKNNIHELPLVNKKKF